MTLALVGSWDSPNFDTHRLATNTFITLQSLCEHRYNLTSLVSCKFFMEHKLSETTQGRLASTIVLDRKLWDECLMIVKVVTPIGEVLAYCRLR